MTELPLFAHARRSDPDTSKVAAKSVGLVAELQLEIVWILGQFGSMSDPTLAAHYWDYGSNLPRRATPQNIRSRRAELVKAGLVCDTGKREIGPSGRPFVVWGLTK